MRPVIGLVVGVVMVAMMAMVVMVVGVVGRGWEREGKREFGDGKERLFVGFSRPLAALLIAQTRALCTRCHKGVEGN